LTVSGTNFAGADPADFSISSSFGCSTPIAPNHSCQLGIGFTPSATGPRHATLQISSNDPDHPTTDVGLSGSGLVPTPILSVLRVSPVSFTAAKSGPSIAMAPIGSKVSFTLSEAASVRFTVQRGLPGIRRAHGCARHVGRVARGKRCTRYAATPGSLQLNGTAGANHFLFTGRLAGRALAPGSYHLRAIATAAGLTSQALLTTFRIVAA
jgi:hypothetical protein